MAVQLADNVFPGAVSTWKSFLQSVVKQTAEGS